MHPSNVLLCCNFLFLFVAGNPVLSQAPNRSSEIQKIILDFGQSDEKLLRSLGGEVYTSAVPQAKGSPFYPSEKWISGSINLPRLRFEDVLLKYDSYSDQVVFLAKDGSQPAISLNPAQLVGFQLQETYFEYFPRNDSLPFSGFVSVSRFKNVELYEKVYAKLEKGVDDPFGTYNIKHKFFIKAKGKYYPMKKKKDLFEALGEQQGKLKDFLKKNKFSVRRLSANDFVQILTYYEGL